MYKNTDFYSQAAIEGFRDPDGKNGRILISITSPPLGFNWGSHPANIHEDTWADVLRLEFDDVDPSHMNATQVTEYRVFNDEDAEKVIWFLYKYRDDVPQAIVHCEAGISRSAAVCKFICYLSNLEFPQEYNLYNKHVYSTLLRVWGAQNGKYST